MSFLRGALIGAANTGTAMRQQALADDEQKIANKVKAYGPAYDAYSKGVSEFAKENEKIKTVASMLEAQDPDFVENLSAADLEDVAQSLILRSGKDKPGEVLDYFMTNRNKLSVVQGAKPEAPTTAADMQTSQMLTKTSTQPDNRSFFQRAFGGSTDEQLKARTAKELGISIEEYDKVMANKVPTIGAPTTMLRLTPTSQYEQIIKDRHQTVSNIITKPEMLRMQDIKLPNERTISGKQLSASIIKGYEDFMLTGEGGKELAELQRFAMTLVMPPDTKNLFKDLHGPSLKIIDENVGNQDLSSENRDRLATISKQLDDYMIKSITVPDFATANGGKNLVDVGNLVIEGMQIAGVAGKTKGGEDSEYVKGLRGRLDNLLTRMNTNPERYSPEQHKRVPQLHEQISIALAENNVGALKDIEGLMGEVYQVIPDKAADKPSVFKEKVDAMVEYMLGPGGFANSPQAKGKSEAEIEKLARTIAGFRVQNGDVLIQGVPHQKTIVNGNTVTVPIPRGMLNETVVPNDADGTTTVTQELVPLPGVKVMSENSKAIKRNTAGIMDLGEIYVGLQAAPNAYNFLGASFKSGVNIVQALADTVDAGDITPDTQIYQILQQKAIPLIASAKDRLFQDPRLSDRDLKIVLDYVGLIRPEGEFGLSKKNALAALFQLRKAMVADQMLRMAENNRSLQKDVLSTDGSIVLHNANGQLKTNTPAAIVAKQIAQSQGFTILNPKQYLALHKKATEAQQRADTGQSLAGDATLLDKYHSYHDEMNIIQDTIKYGTMRSQAFIDSGYNVTVFRDQHKDKSGLPARTGMSISDSALQQALAEGQQRWESLAGYDSGST